MWITPAKRTSVVLPIVTVILLLICLLAPGPASASQRAPAAVSGMILVENAGQFAPGARFLLIGGSTRVWVADDGLWLVTTQQPQLTSEERQLPLHERQRLLARRPAAASAVRLTFAGAEFAGKLEPFGRQDTLISFLHGSDPAGWQTDVPAWAGVRVRDLYRGVDLVIGGDARGVLPWRIEAQPGANLRQVRLQVAGATSASAAAGRLDLQTAAGALSLPLPFLAGAKAGGAATVSATAASDFEVSAPFNTTPLAEPDAAADLIWATFVGGDGLDWGRSIAVDSSGNSYVAGDTQAFNFPVTPGVIDPAGEGATGSEAFVAKLNAGGTGLLYATYLGGSGFDYAWNVATANDIAYVTGDSDSQDFPGAGTAQPAGLNDMYVAALNSTGTAINFAKFFGGTGPDYGYGVALDAGNIYAVGSTSSTDFPATVTSGARGNGDVIVVKLSSAGATTYAAQVGGTGQDEGYALEVRSGEVFGAGETWSTDFPGGATIAGGSDALIFKLSTTGAVASSVALGDTLLATPFDDFAQGLALDAAGNVYVTGGTSSTAFPVTPGTPAFAGGLRDAFASKLSLSGTTWTVEFSVLIGGAGLEDGYGIAVDNNTGGIFVSGDTDSTGLPVTTGAYDTTQNGLVDGFLVRVHPDAPAANRLTYGTYLGGTGYEGAYGVALDAQGNALLVGATDSTDFPVTTGAYDTFLGVATNPQDTSADAFVAKIRATAVPAAPVLSIAASVNDAALSWTQVTVDTLGAPMVVSGYGLWHSLDPYFLPGDTSSPSPTYNGLNLNYTDPGVSVSPDNYYYIVYALGPGGEQSANSNRVGEFTFGLAPGQ